MRRAAFLVSLATFSSMVVADETKTPFYVEGQAPPDDLISKRFFFEVKEQIRSSSTLRLVDSADDAIDRIRIISLDINGRDAIAYSVAWVAKGLKETAGIELYRNHNIAICPASQLQLCARAILADADLQREQDSKIWSDAIKSLKQ